MSEKLDYNSKVENCIKRCLSNGAQQLVDIIRECKGAYPTVVLECLNNLNPIITKTLTKTFALPLAHRNEFLEQSSLEFMEGNPILSSWYFTDETCEHLAKLRDWSNLKIVFLGTPKLYKWFHNNKLGQKRLLLDLDNTIINKLSILSNGFSDSIILYDVATDIPQGFLGKFDCVFFDPPWYTNEYLLWLYRASLLAPGGFLFFSLFPELTRPTGEQERGFIMDKLAKCTELVILLSSFLNYDIPSFEKAQLEACGIKDIKTWKQADLIICEVKSHIQDFETQNVLSTYKDWKEIDINSLRIFVNVAKFPCNEPKLLFSPENSSNILSSPSRRNPLLQSINVLTSRGHGMISGRPEELVIVLEKLKFNVEQGQSVKVAIQNLSTDKNTSLWLSKIIDGV